MPMGRSWWGSSTPGELGLDWGEAGGIDVAIHD